MGDIIDAVLAARKYRNQTMLIDGVPIDDPKRAPLLDNTGPNNVQGYVKKPSGIEEDLISTRNKG
jgi:hypothetical protein